ncbi:hypothetical protein GCM10023351_13560 [Microbacterium gilvum]|uniref:Uncharacterized protein n=2 Tax=Microbacterium gilvum TaxID=1336204 RepID=A0ABP9A201_9MICO
MARAVVAVSMLAAMLLPAGCLTGDGVSGGLARALADDPAVVETDLTTADGMPFTGGAGGTVTVVDDLDDNRLAAISERIRSHDEGADVRVDVVVGGWRVPVLRDAARNEEALGVLRELRADDALVSGSLIADDAHERLDGVSVVTRDAERAIAFVGGDAPHAPATRAAEDVDGVLSLRGRAGEWVRRGVVAWRALTAEIPVVSTEIDADGFDVRILEEDDAARAQAILAHALDGSGMAVFVSSELVVLAPGAQGHAVRALIASLPSPPMSAWSDDRSASLEFPTADDLLAAARSVGATTLDPVTLSAPGIEVGDDPARLEARMEATTRVIEHDGVAAVRVNPSTGVTLQLDEGAAPTADYASALRELARTGERICVERPAEAVLCVTAADRIEGEGSFADAWNAAR